MCLHRSCILIGYNWFWLPIHSYNKIEDAKKNVKCNQTIQRNMFSDIRANNQPQFCSIVYDDL